tara:strand:- start:558 stop:812 length:255 start_codon:yes stop_codon:yes gene_type:complete
MNDEVNISPTQVLVVALLIGFCVGVMIGYYFVGVEVESNCYKNIMACEEFVQTHCMTHTTYRSIPEMEFIEESNTEMVWVEEIR